MNAIHTNATTLTGRLQLPRLHGPLARTVQTPWRIARSFSSSGMPYERYNPSVLTPVTAGYSLEKSRRFGNTATKAKIKQGRKNANAAANHTPAAGVR